MKAWRLLTCLALTAVIFGCGGAAVLMDFHRDALWSNYRTYDWMPKPRLIAIGPLAENPQNLTSITDAVENEMTQRGLRRDTENPDLLVAYYAGLRTNVDPTAWGYEYGPPDSYNAGLVEPVEYEAGTLIIDLVDAQTKKLSWRGWSPGIINAPNNDKVENSIRTTVKKVLATYPPR